jgi:acyl-CoA reductase-like NAD-dependent aldehyde dehydrogenase
MRSYCSYIAGTDVTSSSWIYTVRASALLKDFLSNLKVKRKLEKESGDPGDQYPNIVARCAVTADNDLEQALIRAKEAGPIWASFSIEQRLSIAERFHVAVLMRREEFIDVLVAEGHPRKLAEWEIAGILQCSSPESLKLWKRQLHEECRIGPRRLMLVRKPDGVVVLSPPQNAAASNSVGGLSSLVAGNTLVVKAPKSCPYGVMYVWRELIAPILEDVGAPPGTLSIVCGNSTRIMAQWLESPLVNDIFFFGGSERGIQIGIDACARGKKPVLELAGNDGCVIWKDADIDKAAEALTECFYGSGQICMVPKFSIVHPDIAQILLDKLSLLIDNIKPGLPEDPDVLLSPVLRTDEYFRFLNESTASGATIVKGGYRVELDGTVSETGPFLAPTILRINGLQEANKHSSVREETFFPLLPIIVPEADSENLLDEVIHFINANKYGLRNSFWVKDEAVIEQLVARVSNGGLLKINDSHIGFTPWLATHGGTGLTGGPFGELNYPLVRTSHLQGISIAEGVRPVEAVFESATREKEIEEIRSLETVFEVVVPEKEIA